MGQIVENSPVQAAFAEGVREAAKEIRGGPPGTYRALRELGFDGLIEILQRRVDAEY